MKLSLLLILVCVAPVFAQEYTVDKVPNNRLVNGSHVSNPDGIISAETAMAIDTLLQEVEDSVSAQIAVVLVTSIGDADLFDFSQSLFETWGIGQASNDNGLLILLIKDEERSRREVRFHTGRGLEGVLPDARCKQIQRNFMVPHFKEGDYDQGMLDGVKEVAKILTDPNYTDEVQADTNEVEISDFAGFSIFFGAFYGFGFLIAWASKNGRFKDSKSPTHTDFPEMRVRRLVWLIEFGLMPALILSLFGFSGIDNALGFAILSLYGYFILTIIHRLWREGSMIRALKKERKYFEITEYLRKTQWYWLFIGLLFPLFLINFPFQFARRKFYRYHPRRCQNCEGRMTRLNEQQEDAHLSKLKQAEEALKSVDYDVWICESCSSVETWAFPNRWTKYESCPACHSMGYYQESSQTITAATYSSSGKGKRVMACKVCGNKKTETFSIAQLVHSSSSSSSGSSWSSSSSSGSSWGGGSSGGGGASSSW